jgi:hypothetical protein
MPLSGDKMSEVETVIRFLELRKQAADNCLELRPNVNMGFILLASTRRSTRAMLKCGLQVYCVDLDSVDSALSAVIQMASCQKANAEKENLT